MTKSLKQILTVVGGSLAIIVIIFMVSILPQGMRQLAPLETIHGFPYATAAEWTVVSESLAHADLSLVEPVFAKQLKLTFNYQPGNVHKLAVGVRDNVFWLSYPKTVFYDDQSDGTDNTKIRTASVTIPLTDKLQDKDRTVDVMFFANPDNSPPVLSDATSEKVEWRVSNLKASVSYSLPTMQQVRAYVRSIVKQERAI